MPWTVDSSGTQSATVGTEHVLRGASTSGSYVFDVDTSALVLGDLLELRVYDGVIDALRLAWKGTYQHGQISPDKVSPPVAVTSGAVFTLKQVSGTARTFPWSIRYMHAGSALRYFVAGTSANNDPGNPFTTSAIDTTGATLLVVASATYDPSQTGTNETISDNKSNTWIGLTARLTGSNSHMKLFYVLAPTVGTGHTFTYNGTGFSSICVAAFKGPTAFDQQSGSGNSGSLTTIQPGSITPAAANNLLVTGVMGTPSGYPSRIDSGFFIPVRNAGGSGGNFPCTLAYLIQSSATAQNPTWTHSNPTPQAATAMASFI